LGGPGAFASLARVQGASDLDDASGWAPHPFATPGGPNDVPADATDAEGDGIPDSAEVPGGRFAGLDLHAMGARTGQKDIFIELDHMAATDPGILPSQAALDKAVAVFARRGIHLHFDAGTRFSPGFQPSLHNLGQGSPVVPYAFNISLQPQSGFASNLHALKADHMRLARRSVFHYGLFASSQNLDGSPGNAGLAELFGNDFLVTLGGLDFGTETPEARTLLENFQASSVIHELGHNLGLDHGGDVPTNHKPNYLSVMNYLYAFNGLGPLSGASAGDRYHLQWGQAGYTSNSQLADSPRTSSIVLDLSDGSGAALNEGAVDELAGLGRPGATFVDYDGDQRPGVIAIDLNRDGKKEVLRDHDDWANLRFPFRAARSGVDGLRPGAGGTRQPSVVDDLQPVAHEEPWMGSSRSVPRFNAP
jgi:hypothetical protein